MNDQANRQQVKASEREAKAKLAKQSINLLTYGRFKTYRAELNHRAQNIRKIRDLLPTLIAMNEVCPYLFSETTTDYLLDCLERDKYESLKQWVEENRLAFRTELESQKQEALSNPKPNKRKSKVGLTKET